MGFEIVRSPDPPLGVYLGRGLDPWILSEPWIDNSFKRDELDCGPLAVSHGLHVASGTLLDFQACPNVRVYPDAPTLTTAGWPKSYAGQPAISGDTKKARALALILWLRYLGGAQPTGGVVVGQLYKGFTSMAPEFAALGLTAPKATWYQYDDFDTTFLTAMAKPDRWAMIEVWYPTLRAQQPLVAGQCSGVQEHYVLVGEYDPAGDSGNGTFVVLDPLCDGRSDASAKAYCPAINGTPNVAAGPQLWKKATLRKAAGAVTNAARSFNGKVTCFVLTPSTLVTTGAHACDTTLAASSIVGASNFKVTTAVGMYAGDTIQLGPPNTEQLTIATVGTAGAGGTGITVTATHAAFAHTAGDRVLTGDDLDPVGSGGDGFAGWNPCSEA